MKRILFLLVFAGSISSCKTDGADNSQDQISNVKTESSNRENEKHVVVSGVKLPEISTFGNIVQTLVGAGTRVKFFMHVYVIGLYMEEPSKDPEIIINADKAMKIRLQIISSMLTNDVMVKYIREGFERSLDGKTENLKDEIDLVCSVFSSEPTKVGDVYDLQYVPNAGILASKNGTPYSFENIEQVKNGSVKLIRSENGRLAIPGIELKKGVFGIWFSDDPVDPKLKEEVIAE